MTTDTTGLKKSITDEIEMIEKKAYSRGFEDGKEAKEELAQKAYQKGLDDAWECARKLMLSSYVDGGIASTEIVKIFGVRPYYTLKDFSASEAIAKIKEYEEKQEAENEIKVGDEVTAEDGAANINYGLNMAIDLILSTGDCNNCKHKGCVFTPKPGELLRYNCPSYEPKEKQE